MEWLPFFANYRRDGYDFDALWDDEKASVRQKKIMDLFADGNEDAELFSNEIKEKAGFGKGKEKGFEGVITNLQMQLYLCPYDFRKRTNKKGATYGWPVAVYATPEHIYGRELVTAAYNEAPEKSAERIIKHIEDVYPIAAKKQIGKILGGKIRC